MEQGNRQWEGKTGGGGFGQWFLLTALRRIDVRFFYPMLIIAIPFYLIFGKKGRKAAFSYFRNRHGFSFWKSCWHTLLNHIRFGEVVLDKFALLAENKKQFKIIFEGEDKMVPHLQGSSGFVIVSAHIGNLEMAGLCISHKGKKTNSIIFGGESAKLQLQRNKVFAESNIQLIPVEKDMSHLFTIKEALENGEIVVVPCDRILGSPKAVECSFINGDAQFPIGPFRIAAQLEVPVLSLFIMKERNNTYRVFTNDINCREGYSNTTQKANAMVAEYVKQLESVVKRYPDQWFNFFPFWKESEHQ